MASSSADSPFASFTAPSPARASSMRGHMGMQMGGVGGQSKKASFRELTPEELEDRVVGDIQPDASFERTRSRHRAATVIYGTDDTGEGNDNFKAVMSNNWVYSANRFLASIYVATSRSLKFYLKSLALLTVVLVAGGQARSSTVILGLSTREWFNFLLHMIVIHGMSTVWEIILFLSVDFFFSDNYDFIYMMRSLEGPLAFLITIGVLVNFFNSLALPHIGIGWGGIVTVLITILICYTWKSWYVRKYYLEILKNRLAPKLEAVAIKKSILSIIASITRLGGSNPRPWEEDDYNGGVKSRSESFESGTEVTGAKSVFKAFREIVNEAENKFTEETSPEDDDEEVGSESRVSSFWKNLNSTHRTQLLQGSMSVSTVSGEILIRDKKTAMRFGKHLYQHISKNGTVNVTTATIGEAIRSSQFMTSSAVLADSTVNSAMLMFRHAEESPNILVTEADIVSGVKHVFRSMKYAAGSFSDLQELNQSVLTIVNVIFWIVMFLVAQLILQLDTTTLLAPILTILFGASFAFASMLSNMLTSVSFVLFLCPYDVGHRVILGYGTSQYAKGNILSVNLFYTTMITNFNQKVILIVLCFGLCVCEISMCVCGRIHIIYIYRCLTSVFLLQLVIPNHVLFDERIMNLAESKFATFDLAINFCADGPLGSSRAVIDEYFRRVKDYMLVKQKGEWKEVDFYCVGYDAPKNVLEYSVWCSHEGGWSEVGSLFVCMHCMYCMYCTCNAMQCNAMQCNAMHLY
jgi:hypothetical protein